MDPTTNTGDKLESAKWKQKGRLGKLIIPLRPSLCDVLVLLWRLMPKYFFREMHGALQGPSLLADVRRSVRCTLSFIQRTKNPLFRKLQDVTI